MLNCIGMLVRARADSVISAGTVNGNEPAMTITDWPASPSAAT
ncbi:hypothetical protein [Enterobacter ludwigii]